MLKIYFGEWGDGKLQRLPYLGYYLLLMVLPFIIIVGGIIAVGATESLMSWDMVEIQALIMDKFGIVAMLGLAVLMFLVMIGQVNILAKRIRDMGLPALWTILAIILLSMLLNVVFPPQEVSLATSSVQTIDTSATAVAATYTTSSMIVHIFDIIIFACLVLIPSNTFNNSKNHY